MNAQRRAALAALQASITDAVLNLELLRDEEQDYYDNMPESFQNGDKGNAAQEAIDNLEQAINSLQEAEEAVEGAQS